MRYRTMCFQSVIIIALLALTAILISPQNPLNAIVDYCNPMNENCNYQIKRVTLVIVLVLKCTEDHDLAYEISYTKMNMAWCSVHGTEPGPFQYFFMDRQDSPVEHSDDETTPGG